MANFRLAGIQAVGLSDSVADAQWQWTSIRDPKDVIWSCDQFKELLEIVFSFLKEPTKSGSLHERLESFAEDHGINAAGLKSIKTLVSIPNSGLKRNLSPNQMKEDLIHLGFSEDKGDAFVEKYNDNLVALSKTALGHTLMVNQLVDMEWKFGVTAASSEVNKVGNTFLQLKLKIDKGTKYENVYMELTLPQFYSFLHEMERAKASLDVLS